MLDEERRRKKRRKSECLPFIPSAVALAQVASTISSHYIFEGVTL